MQNRLTRIAWMAIVLAAVLAALAPAGASAFQKAVWGPLTVHGVNQFPLYKSLGAKVYEAELNWNTVAPRKPKTPNRAADPAYVWPVLLGKEISAAERYGMRVVLEVGNAPAWANGGHKRHRLGAEEPARLRALHRGGSPQVPRRPHVDDLGRAQPQG